MTHYIVTNRSRSASGHYGGRIRSSGEMDFLRYDEEGARKSIRKERFFGEITADLARQLDDAKSDDGYHSHDPHRPLIIVFVHGYNVDFSDSERWANHMGELASRVPGPPVVVTFSWPSQGQIASYLDDRGEARLSAGPFYGLMQETIRRLEHERCAAELVGIAHSMGNYLLAHAASYAFEARGNPAQFNIFSELILAAPDLDDNALEPGHVAEYLPRIARRLHVYRSDHDRALLASSAKRGGVTGGRLGRQGPADPDAIAENVVVIDASGPTKDVDWPPHSAHFHVPEVLGDMRQVVFGVDRTVIAGRRAVEDIPGEFQLLTEQELIDDEEPG